MIKYAGYGNLAGFFAYRGIFFQNKVAKREEGDESEDSDTEVWTKSASQVDPVTGVLAREGPNPMEGMTDEQKQVGWKVLGA